MAYRNPLAWNRDIRPGMFKSDPNAQLPEPEQYQEDEPTQLQIDLQLAKDYEAIDRMNAENDALYAQSMMPPVRSTRIPYSQAHLITEDPARRQEIINAH